MPSVDYTIRPIIESDLDRVSPACWDAREVQLKLLEQQAILGFGAWQADYCIGALHCYRVTLPAYDDALFPGYGRDEPRGWPLGWPLLAAREMGITLNGPVWGQACFHVGYAGPTANRADPAYFGRGIGTALLQASIAWARAHAYAGIIAHAGPSTVPLYNSIMGCLPHTTYERYGFTELARDAQPGALGWFVPHSNNPALQAQARQAVEDGTPPEDICARLMVLRS